MTSVQSQFKTEVAFVHCNNEHFHLKSFIVWSSNLLQHVAQLVSTSRNMLQHAATLLFVTTLVIYRLSMRHMRDSSEENVLASIAFYTLQSCATRVTRNNAYGLKLQHCCKTICLKLLSELL